MNRSTDQALQSLLPTHNGAFPQALVDFAGSLLAQTRHRASTLKADEEVARPYACAHIACDRLKAFLNLPPIDPRPPIQPRLYRRLYAHLNAITQLAPEPVGGRFIRGSFPASSPVRNSTTASAATAAAAATTPRKTPSRSRRAVVHDANDEAAAIATSCNNTPRRRSFPPPWLRPTVRFVCGDLGQPQLAPTLMAGLSAISREAVLTDRDEGKGKSTRTRGGGDGDDNGGLAVWVEHSWTALTAALYLYCATSWRSGYADDGTGTGVHNGLLEEAQFQADEKAILASFGRVRAAPGSTGAGGVQPAADTDTTVFWAGWRQLRRHTFRDALVMVSNLEWLQSDWYWDIAAMRAAHDGGATLYDEHKDRDGDRPLTLWRADSMLQERYDFLNAARQRTFEVWRSRQLAQISEVEQQQQHVQAQTVPQVMQVDS